MPDDQHTDPFGDDLELDLLELEPEEALGEVEGVEVKGELIETLEGGAALVGSVKPTRPPGWLALLLLGVVTLVCVVAIAATLVLPVLFVGLEDAPDDAIQPLTTLATLGVGALAALLGGESQRRS